MIKTFNMKIITPEKTIFKDKVISSRVETKEGLIQFMANHEATLLKIVPTVAKIVLENGNEEKYFISDGVAKFYNNEFKICCGVAKMKEK